MLDVKESSLRPLKIQPVYFGSGDAQNAAKNITADISSVLGEIVSLLPAVAVPDVRSAQEIGSLISPDADALLALGFPVWGKKLAEQGRPILFWSRFGEGYYDPWTKDPVSFLRSKGAKVYDFVTPDEARETVRALRTVARMRHSKILYFGEPAGLTKQFEMAGVMGSSWDFKNIQKILGPSVEQISNSHLLEHSDAVSDEEAREVLEKWRADFESLDADGEKKLLEVAKMYRAIESLMSERGANAMTINCLSDLSRQRFIPPCIALARLMDEGAPAACEGDLNTLLTMMLFSFTSGEPPIMGNIYLFRPEFGQRFPPPQGVIVEDTKMYLKDNKARLTHDVIPLSLAKSKYELEDFHNTGKGATAYATLRSDEVATFGRIDPRLDRVVFTVAKIESVEDSVICRFSAWLKMKNTEEYIRNISSIHSAMVYGDWSSTLHKVAEIMGFEPIEI